MSEESESTINISVTAEDARLLGDYGSIGGIYNLLTFNREALAKCRAEHADDIAKIRDMLVDFAEYNGISDENLDGFISDINKEIHVPMKTLVQDFELDVTIKATVTTNTTVMVQARSLDEARKKIADGDYSEIDGFDPKEDVVNRITWAEIEVNGVDLY